MKVYWSKTATKSIERLDAKLRERIRSAVYGFASTGRGDIERLKRRGGFRLRVGD